MFGPPANLSSLAPSSVYFWEYNLFTSFLLSISSLQALPYLLPHLPSKSWTPFPLVVMAFTNMSWTRTRWMRIASWIGVRPWGLDLTQKSKDNRAKLGVGEVALRKEEQSNWLLSAKGHSWEHTYIIHTYIIHIHTRTTCMLHKHTHTCIHTYMHINNIWSCQLILLAFFRNWDPIRPLSSLPLAIKPN